MSKRFMRRGSKNGRDCGAITTITGDEFAALVSKAPKNSPLYTVEDHPFRDWIVIAEGNQDFYPDEWVDVYSDGLRYKGSFSVIATSEPVMRGVVSRNLPATIQAGDLLVIDNDPKPEPLPVRKMRRDKKI